MFCLRKHCARQVDLGPEENQPEIKAEMLSPAVPLVGSDRAGHCESFCPLKLPCGHDFEWGTPQKCREFRFTPGRKRKKKNRWAPQRRV